MAETDTPDDVESYGNVDRAFLQAFIARSTLTFEDAKPLLAAILTAHHRHDHLAEDVTETEFHKRITIINNAISPYDLEIRSTFHQSNRQRIYALVNSTSDPLTQLATIRTADEISYVKRLLDGMFETNNTRRREVMALTAMQALSLAKAPTRTRATVVVTGDDEQTETQGGQGQSLTMVHAEKALKQLVDEGWFEKSRKGFYSLSPRALMELRGWLMETYNDDGDDVEQDNDNGDGQRMIRIKTCYACKEIITTGQRCSNRECACRLHDICTQKFFTAQKSRRCPLCKSEWSGQDFVGERAADKPSSSSSAAARLSNSRRSNGPAGTRQSTTNGARGNSELDSDANDVDAEEEDDAEESISAGQENTRSMNGDDNDDNDNDDNDDGEESGEA